MLKKAKETIKSLLNISLLMQFSQHKKRQTKEAIQMLEKCVLCKLIDQQLYKYLFFFLS